MLTHDEAIEDVRCHLQEAWTKGVRDGIEVRDQSTHKMVTIEAPEFANIAKDETYLPKVRYDVIKTEEPDGGEHFIYPLIKTVNANQTTIRATQECGERITTVGMVELCLYLSKLSHTQPQEDFITKLLLQIFRRKQTKENQVWFKKDARITCINPSSGFYRRVLFTTFRFDEIT